MSALWVEVVATKGSAPRDAGTAMKVTSQGTKGTIGGGALELAAIAKARSLLAAGKVTATQTIPLGPRLGQCCGGAVTLCYGSEPRPTDDDMHQGIDLTETMRPAPPLWVWGAGHVGRAVVGACPPHAFDITWIDSHANRFPTSVPEYVTAVPAVDMPRLVGHAPKQAHHLIFTYAHDIDLALCAALIRHGFASCGLIGSDTKWTRFQKRLQEMGLDPAPILCPIGDKSLGKRPADIARGTLEALVNMTQERLRA